MNKKNNIIIFSLIIGTNFAASAMDWPTIYTEEATSKWEKNCSEKTSEPVKEPKQTRDHLPKKVK